MTTMDDAQAIVRAAPGFLAPAAGGAVPGPAAGPGLGAGDAWRIIKQRKLLITVTFAVLYLLVVAATFLIWRYWPTYTSHAYLQLVAPTQDPLGVQEMMLPKDYVQQRVNTEVAGLKSYETLNALLARPEIKETAFYRGYKSLEECLYDLQDRLVAAPVRDSPLIHVALAVKHREEATRIVNTLVEIYVEGTKKAVRDEGGSRLNDLKNTRAQVEAELTEKRRQIADLRAQRDMPALESARDVLVQTTAMLTNTKAELLARQADIQAQLATVQGVDPRNLPISAEMRLMIEQDPELRMYRQQVDAMNIQMTVLRQHRYGENHRLMRELQSQRDEYAQKEAARREELIDNLRARQIESLGQEQARIRMTLAEVQEQLSQYENEQRDLDSAITRLDSLVKDEDRLNRLLEQVATAVREAEHRAVVQGREGRLAIVGRAKDAILPTRPQPVIYLGGGFVLCLLVAVGLAFLREFTDQALRTPIDVARYGHLSVLGCVPLLDEEQADIDEIEQATRLAPHSLVAEAFRQIRAHLVFSGPLESQRTLLITSPRPEDGKTAVAVNLAVTFAQASRRVLLIDANFRRPAVARAFGGDRAAGLSHVLVGHCRLEEAIARTELPSLDLLGSGPMPPNPAELLGSPQMHALLAAAKQSYERIILDGPPCLLISDALVIATQVDGVVVVARAAQGTKGALRRAREQLQRINARVIGAVLNGVQARPGGYFRQQYREFYDYTSDEVVPRELTAGPPELNAGRPDADDRG